MRAQLVTLSGNLALSLGKLATPAEQFLLAHIGDENPRKHRNRGGKQINQIVCFLSSRGKQVQEIQTRPESLMPARQAGVLCCS